jgi:Nucleoside-diphosphate-sugar pyrophosphorylase involved in lipopolysaccharide biosynthesis/translation initiation factor 2B, gamma/epsilon subunits (eIF-2Bgamma/eIF-2Bepsilon)
MILAAGLGTRLQPLTLSKPKALVQINSITLLERNIRRLMSFDIDHIVINIHHFPEHIIDFVNSKHFDCHIVFSREQDILLDTGGGLKHAQNLFIKDTDILVHNVDILSDIDFSLLYETHKKSNALVTLATRKRDSSRHLFFDACDKLCGWENTKTKERIDVRNSNKATQKLAFSGIQIIDYNLLSLMDKQGAFPIIPEYLKLAERYTIKSFDHSLSKWIDVGKLPAIKEAERLF